MSTQKSSTPQMTPLLLAMGMILLASWPPVRDGLGSGLDLVLGPLLDTFQIPFYIVIIILSSITAVYSSTIQKYTIDYDKMKQVQEKMKVFQQEYREAMLAKDEKRTKKLEARREVMMKDQMEMSTQQFQPMAYIMIITLPIFFWLIFRLNNFDALISMPFFGTVHLTDAVLGPAPAWIIWYMICSLTLSQVARKALDIGGI